MTRGRRLALVVVACALCVGAASCDSSSSSSTTGSDEVVTRRITVESFSRLEVATAFDVRVSVGDSERVTVRVSRDVEDDLDVGVSGSTLRVSLERGLAVSDATLEADVTVRSLDGIGISGASGVELLDELGGTRLTATLSGASRLDGRIRASRAKVSLSGASRARLAGDVSDLEASGSGASDLSAADLTVGTLTVDLSGASRAEVTVTGSIAADLSGASSLGYGGSPRFVKQEVSGGSSINPL